MTIDEVVHKIGEVGIIPVVRATNFDDACRAVEGIRMGGIPIVEITMTVPGAPAVMRKVAEQLGKEVLVGAGTVLTAEQATECLDAGAEFLVSPGLSLPVLKVARAREKLAVPGALTPTEIMTALAEGARLIKIFPCGSIGGPKYLKALRGPFPQVTLVPTGGVNAANAAEYFAAGAFALGVGADLVDPVALREGNVQKIADGARELVEAVRSARSKTQPN